MSLRDPNRTVPPGDPDFKGVEAALRRAAERARREAAAVGGRVVVFKDGKIVWEKPGPEWLSKGERQPRDRRESASMPVFDLFSKRQKKLRGEVPDVYSYDSIPEPLRVQIVHILRDALGNGEQYYLYMGHVRQAYDFIVDVLCREYGVFRLVDYPDSDNKFEDLSRFLIQESATEKILDAVETSFQYIDRNFSSDVADQAIEELNYRFKEHGVGYCFVNGEIIRIDSQLIHAEVVKPALTLLSQREYAGAQEEFLRAHKHYRQGNAEEALNECLKAFESVMKSICEKRDWPYDDGAGASKLIGICLDNGLIPSFWQQNFQSLKSLLESSVPTGRNKLSSHGRGSTQRTVPGYIVGYMLHMTAAAIVFLAEAAANERRQ